VEVSSFGTSGATVQAIIAFLISYSLGRAFSSKSPKMLSSSKAV
jgi:hypothetical protein